MLRENGPVKEPRGRPLQRRILQDNEGSTARDHLANERTFLAWVRTALGLIGLGVVVGKLVETDGREAELAGLLLIVLGAGALVYSIVRYEQVTNSLNEGKYLPARWGPLAMALVSLAVAVAAVLLVVPG